MRSCKAVICALALLLLPCFAALSGCFTETDSLVNSLSFDIADDAMIHISYESDNITLLRNSDGTLVLKEYMSRDQEDYYATSKLEDNGSSLTIVGGNRPSANYESYVEVLLPRDFCGTLYIDTGSGSVSTRVDLDLEALHMTSDSGSFNASYLAADTVDFQSVNGGFTVTEGIGTFHCTTTSGSVNLSSMRGGGDFSTESGGISITCKRLGQGLTLHTVSGSIKLTIPNGMRMRTIVSSQDGQVVLPYAEEDIQVDPESGALEAYLDVHTSNQLIASSVSGSIRVAYA